MAIIFKKLSGRFIGGAAKAGELIDDIAEASREQAREMEQISRNVSDMDGTVQENAGS
jgi:methyl-accepting chemotaxis protein